MILLSATAFTPWTVAHGQDIQTNQHSVSIRQQPSAPAVPGGTTFDAERERLYNELAEEFATFNRLGNLVRRVSTLVKPSVIHIEAHKTEERGGTRESYDEAGSGVVLQFSNDEYWVLTNRHVVAGAKPREILLRSSSGTEFYPEKVLSDASTDVAVMKITEPVIPAARLGDSSGVGIGDFVIAIGAAACDLWCAW